MSTKAASKSTKTVKAAKAEPVEVVAETSASEANSAAENTEANTEPAAKKAAKVTKPKESAKPAKEAKETKEVKEAKEEEPEPETKKVLAKKTTAKKVVKPIEVAEEEEPEEETEDSDEKKSTKKRQIVVKGKVEVVSTAKARAKSAGKAKPATKKSPRTSSAKSSARSSPTKSPGKSPVKKTAAKKTTKKATAAKKTTGGKRVVKKSAKSTKVVKARRPVNTKPAPIDFSGIGIGPAKVKKVLMHSAFNPQEYETRLALIKAEAKPIKPKPTKDNPDPEMPAQGKQTPINKMRPEHRAIIEAAERAYLQSLEDDYIHFVVNGVKDENNKVVGGYDAKRKALYTEHRKEAQSRDNYDAHASNLAFDPHFYDGYDEFCRENDTYALDRVVTDKKTGEEKIRFNDWTRAMTLVNKTCIRLSNGVRNILACYLDNIVMQYAENGIENCIAEGHSNLQLRHALTETDGFAERVPIDAFVRTLDSHRLAHEWINECVRIRSEVQAMKKKLKKDKSDGEVNAEIPEYPNPGFDENFDGYVVDICRSVRVRLANKQKGAENKEKYHNIKISDNFKKFCSYAIYEAILRIGSHLKDVVELKDVKTVNETLMYHSLKQVSNLCGFDYAPIATDMKVRLARFTKWCDERREQRKSKKDSKAQGDDAAEDEDEEEDEDENVAETADADDADDVVPGDGEEEEEAENAEEETEETADAAAEEEEAAEEDDANEEEEEEEIQYEDEDA